MFVLAWVVFLSITITIARSKGRSALLWGLLACFFPLITIIIVLLLPARSADQQQVDATRRGRGRAARGKRSSGLVSPPARPGE